VLRKKILVQNIRAGRPNPGLASQHLESILALIRISGAQTSSSNLRKGSTEFDLDGRPIPKSSDGISTEIDLVTAGSITLCIQCILPYLLTLRSPSNVRIIGGTHVLKAPNFDYLERVFLPIMNTMMGNEINAKMLRPGYFPRGGGCISLNVNPIPNIFNPVNLIDRGNLVRTHAIINVTPKLNRWINEFKQLVSGKMEL